MAKILLLTHIQPPAVDGGSRVIVKIGEYLNKLGHQTLLISSNSYSTDDFTTHSHKTIASKRQRAIALPVYTFFHKPFKLLSKIFPVFGVFAKGPIFKLIPFLRALSSVISYRPQIIIAGPLPTTIILYARFFRFLSSALAHQRTKLLINASFHPTDPDFQNKLLLNTLKSADYIWTLTDYETNYFNKKLNIPKSKLLNLGNGIDPQLLTNAPSRLPAGRHGQRANVLLYIGSLSKHKNIEQLISTHQLLLKKYPKLKLIIAGQKTLYYPKLKKILKLPNIKTIFNFKTNALSRLLDQSAILVSPSTQESFGLTLIEAWARKTPVIGINIPSSVELITKSNGGLIGLDNIEKLLRDVSLCQKLGQNGYNYVKANYLWPDITQKLCQKLQLL